MIEIGNKAYTFPTSEWEKRWLKTRLYIAGLDSTQVAEALDTLGVWAKLPAARSQEQAAGNALVDVFYKKFSDKSALIRALAGHTLARTNRGQEERLACDVLEHLSEYEEQVLDPLIRTMIVDEELGLGFGTTSYYKAGAVHEWRHGPEEGLRTLAREEPLDRLYKKVAYIHDYSRTVAMLDTPGRNAHAAMRQDKWSLNESDALVKKQRKAGVSVWAGTSGSAMDMVYLAESRGFNHKQLTGLAWCIFAFFHFMPTVQSPTHTFHEVMLGAHKVIQHGLQGYDSKTLKLPNSRFVMA